MVRRGDLGARALGGALAAVGATIPPVGPLEGLDSVGCPLCHLLRVRPGAGHTGGYVAHALPKSLVSTAAIPFFNVPMDLGDLDQHSKTFLEAPQRDGPRACATCHEHRVPDAVHPPVPGLEVANEYDPWAGSRYGRVDSPGRQTCVDCHMPRVDVAGVPTGTRSHAFPSGNTGIAWLGGDRARVAEQEAFLQDGRLEIMAMCSPPRPEGARACVVRVGNVGVGHRFPAGPRDIEDTWLRVRLRREGAVAWVRGADSEDAGAASPVLDWGLRMRDSGGADLDAHQFWKAATLDGAAPIEPDGIAEASFDLPAEAGDGTLEFAVLRRRYNPRFSAAVLGKDVAAPITVVQEATLELAR